MPFTIRAMRLPFLRISSSPKAGRAFVWHVGPWQYNTRTGQHTLKLPGTVKYVSRTRTEKAARAKKRAERRATERAGWETYFAGPPGTPAPTKPAKPGTARAKQAKKAPVQQTRRSSAATSKARPAVAAGTVVSAGRASTSAREAQEAATARYWLHRAGLPVLDEATPPVDTGRRSLAQRQEKARAAGLCGARTQDGSPCLNTGQCPHHAHQTR